MNRRLTVCFFSILVFPYATMAQKTVDSDILNQVYTTLRQQPGILMDSGKYTGSDSQKAGYIEWQRGEGTGWTIGCQLTLHDIRPEEIKKIRRHFESLSGLQYVNRHYSNSPATHVKSTRTVYVYNYIPEDKILYFLKASTTGEICVENVFINPGFSIR